MRDPKAHRRASVCARPDRAAQSWAAAALVVGAVVLGGPALAQTNDPSPSVRWDRPTPGTLQRGVVWVRHPTVVVALAGALGAGVLGAALYQRFRRRPPRS